MVEHNQRWAHMPKPAGNGPVTDYWVLLACNDYTVLLQVLHSFVHEVLRTVDHYGTTQLYSSHLLRLGHLPDHSSMWLCMALTMLIQTWVHWWLVALYIILSCIPAISPLIWLPGKTVVSENGRTDPVCWFCPGASAGSAILFLYSTTVLPDPNQISRLIAGMQDDMKAY